MKYISVNARNSENKQTILKQILNVVSLVAHDGDLPTERDLSESRRKNSFSWWCREDNRFQVGPNNSHWANIKSEDDTDIVIHLHARYDKDSIFTDVLPVIIGFMFRTDEQVQILDVV